MKEKIKDVSFWISIASAFLLFLSFITDNFGIEQEVLVEVYSCVLALLTTLGVLTKNAKSDKEDFKELQEQIKQQINDDNEKNK